MSDQSEFLVNVLTPVFNQYCGNAWLFCGAVTTDQYQGYRFRFEDYHNETTQAHQTLVNQITDRLNDCFVEGTWGLNLDQDYIDAGEGFFFNQSTYVDLIFSSEQDEDHRGSRDIDNDIIDVHEDYTVIDPHNSRIDYSSMVDIDVGNDRDMEVDSLCKGIDQIDLNKNNNDHLKYYTSNHMYFSC